jgi:hypothetical protein
VIDLIAVVNALRVAWPPRSLTDFQASSPRAAQPAKRLAKDRGEEI